MVLGIRPREGKNKPVGPRQIEYDSKHLRAVLEWVTPSIRQVSKS